MRRTQVGPTPGTGSSRTHVRHTRAWHRIPPTVRITAWMVASALKRVIVAGAAYGIIPARLAEWIIRYGGMTHA